MMAAEVMGVNAVLTLQVPDLERGRGSIVAATTDPMMLRVFKRHILAQYEARVREASDEQLRRLRLVEYRLVTEALNLCIPDGGEAGE